MPVSGPRGRPAAAPPAFRSGVRTRVRGLRVTSSSESPQDEITEIRALDESDGRLSQVFGQAQLGARQHGGQAAADMCHPRPLWSRKSPRSGLAGPASRKGAGGIGSGEGRRALALCDSPHLPPLPGSGGDGGQRFRQQQGHPEGPLLLSRRPQ